MNFLDILILCCAALAIVFYVERRIRTLANQTVEFDRPLREVIAADVEFQREFFSEALKLSDEEIDRAPEMVRCIRLRLQIWKTHYSGDVAFYGKFEEDPRMCLLRENIHEFPTSMFQFPMALAKHPLFGKADEKNNDSFGPGSSEKLEVLLSHKAIIIRARDGRFEWGNYKSLPSDLVIPIREDDLQEYVDTYGRDDADWLMMAGDARRYQRAGRWATWRIFAVYPKSLSSLTSSLDAGVVKLND